MNVTTNLLGCQVVGEREDGSQLKGSIRALYVGSNLMWSMQLFAVVEDKYGTLHSNWAVSRLKVVSG